MADSKQQQDGVAPFTEKEVASYPRPCTAIPSAISFSPDDASIGFLHSGGGASLSRQFYAFDVASQTTKQFVDAASVGGDTENNLSLEEKLRRERQRQLGVGVTNYQWTSCGAVGSRLLIPLQGSLYLQDGDGELRLILVRRRGGCGGGGCGGGCCGDVMCVLRAVIVACACSPVNVEGRRCVGCGFASQPGPAPFLPSPHTHTHTPRKATRSSATCISLLRPLFLTLPKLPTFYPPAPASYSHPIPLLPRRRRTRAPLAPRALSSTRSSHPTADPSPLSSTTSCTQCVSPTPPPPPPPPLPPPP